MKISEGKRCVGGTRGDWQGYWSNQKGSSLKCFSTFFPSSPLCLTDDIFYQSAALPPLAAPAQTWKPKTANTTCINTLTRNAAAASVGTALLVSSTQQLDPDFGSIHFALQKAVAPRVSGGDRFGNIFLNSILSETLSHRCRYLAKLPLQLS